MDRVKKLSREQVDAEKASLPRPDLIPPSALLEEGLVMGMGFRKHGDCTWRQLGTQQADPKTHIASAMRHLVKTLLDPMARDQQSGRVHLAHARAQIGIAIECLYQDGALTPDFDW